MHDLAQPVVESRIAPSPTLVIEKNQQAQKILFVPYWSIASDKQEVLDDGYDTYLYFGIVPGVNGLQNEIGMQRTETFLQSVPQGKKKLLVLRMVDSATNAVILKSADVQKKIVVQTTEYAKKYGFDGIVLDLEMSAIPFNSIVKQISEFSTVFATHIKNEGLTYGITLYGDTFYRVRPFDVKTYTAQADQVLLMAYDFHKARSNPGPNFPLQGGETYGYDMQEMIDDYLRVIPSKKVGVIFGMYGYDWQVDEQGKAISQGKAVTLAKLAQNVLGTCTLNDCVVKRDDLSAETKVTYTDIDGVRHVIWFEDRQSVSQKQQYLKSLGIVQYAYWAYGYF